MISRLERERLNEKNLISNLVGKAKSLTPTGWQNPPERGTHPAPLQSALLFYQRNELKLAFRFAWAFLGLNAISKEFRKTAFLVRA